MKKATAEVLHDGWLYTGDMAMEDEDGFIYLVDRKKDVIISGGENIYPVQIEDFFFVPIIKFWMWQLSDFQIIDWEKFQQLLS